MVLGDSMAPEFAEGDVIVVEPEGPRDRRLVRRRAGTTASGRCASSRGATGGWQPAAAQSRLSDACDLADLSPVRGVVIQKSKPGRRRALKRYVE